MELRLAAGSWRAAAPPAPPDPCLQGSSPTHTLSQFTLVPSAAASQMQNMAFDLVEFDPINHCSMLKPPYHPLQKDHLQV